MNHSSLFNKENGLFALDNTPLANGKTLTQNTQYKKI